MAATEESKAPANLKYKFQPTDALFHPSADLVAVGLVTGDVFVYKYGSEKNSKLLHMNHHKGHAIRRLQFDGDGEKLVTCSSDTSLYVMSKTGDVVWNADKAHGASLNALHTFGGHMVASGDMEGFVKIWDLRTRKSVAEFRPSPTVLTEFAHHDPTQTILTTGMGGVGVINMRAGKLEFKGDDYLDDELLSIVVIKGGKKVVCGGQSGALWIYSWGKWDDQVEKFMGHPESVDTIIPIDEDTIATGSIDGIIRLVQIHPNKPLFVLGHHADDFAVEHIHRSHDKNFMVSCGHDDIVRFWDIAYLQEEDDDDEEGLEDGKEAPDGSMAAIMSRTAGTTEPLGDDIDSEFGEWDDEDSDSDSEGKRDDEGDYGERRGRGPPAGRRGPPSGGGGGGSGGGADFFSGM